MSTFTTGAGRTTADLVGRIERLPACRATWTPSLLVSLAGVFEAYDLYQSAYLPPGMIRSGIFNASATRALGLSDQAIFGSVTFLGLFLGATCLAPVADRLGRRTVFLYALLGYSAATALLAFQQTSLGIFSARFLAGIGLGVELVTIDAYLVELVPSHMRGRAFALNHMVQYLGVPLVAFLAWILIPTDPLGIAGWRWVVMFGSLGSLPIWYLRRKLPESPRWLALNGRNEEAESAVAALEAAVERETGQTLPPAQTGFTEDMHRPLWSEIWRPPYGRRTLMLTVFHFFQTIGFFGFTNWLPTLLAAKGHDFTKSLFYSFCIAWAYPLTPLLWFATVAERFERKWLIVAAGLGVAAASPLFAAGTHPLLLVSVGIAIVAFSTLLSLAYHPYQAELFPTEVRARAVGFVYSFSRLSAALTSFLISFSLSNYGVPGVFGLITFSMLMTVLTIGVFGPRTRARPLEVISK